VLLPRRWSALRPAFAPPWRKALEPLSLSASIACSSASGSSSRSTLSSTTTLICDTSVPLFLLDQVNVRAFCLYSPDFRTAKPETLPNPTTIERADFVLMQLSPPSSLGCATRTASCSATSQIASWPSGSKRCGNGSEGTYGGRGCGTSSTTTVCTSTASVSLG